MSEKDRKVYRNVALDFTKGALVLIMVLYHWINYFCGPQDNRYLRFLTPSFIFISGFIISNIYISKYGVSDPRLPKRLIERGLKILGVFVFLNVARNSFASGRAHEQASSVLLSTKSLFAIYVTGSGAGNGQAKAVAFSILVPISYLLILSALLLVVSRRYKYTIHFLCLLFLLSAAITSFQRFVVPNLELLAIGLLGVIAGYLPIESIDTIVGYPYLLALAYVFYLGAITLWNVPFLLQVIGVYLSLMILYRLGQKSGEPGMIRARIVLLGKYSLFGYIAQIAILQALRVGLMRIESETIMLGLSFVLAFALTMISVEMLNRMRVHSMAIDRAYRAVFA